MMSPGFGEPVGSTIASSQSRSPRFAWAGVPENSTLPVSTASTSDPLGPTTRSTVNASDASAKDRMSAATDATSSRMPNAGSSMNSSTPSITWNVPLRKVTSNRKSFIRGSKPGRSP